MPTNFDQEKDHIVLVEVFQVNCPGCFLYGIPEAINIYNKYKDQGVRVLGIATAFEDFDKNTVENLEMLAKTGDTVGETKKALSMYGKSSDGKIPYKIPFPLAMGFYARLYGGLWCRQGAWVFRGDRKRIKGRVGASWWMVCQHDDAGRDHSKI